MRPILLFTILSLITFSACNFDLSSTYPEFQSIENIKIKNLTSRLVTVEADALLKNPNPIAITVADSDIIVMIEKKHKANFKQLKDITIPASSTFSIPLEFSFSPKDIFKDDILGTALSILGNKSVRSEFSGNIYLNLKGVKVPVPIEFEKEIELKKK